MSIEPFLVSFANRLFKAGNLTDRRFASDGRRQKPLVVKQLAKSIAHALFLVRWRSIKRFYFDKYSDLIKQSKDIEGVFIDRGSCFSEECGKLSYQKIVPPKPL